MTVSQPLEMPESSEGTIPEFHLDQRMAERIAELGENTALPR